MKALQTVKKSASKIAVAAAVSGMILCAGNVWAGEKVTSENTGISFEMPDSWMSDQVHVEIIDDPMDMDGRIAQMTAVLFGFSYDDLQSIVDESGEDSDEYKQYIQSHTYRLFSILGVENSFPVDELIRELNESSESESITGYTEVGSTGTHTFYSLELNEDAAPALAEPESEELKAAIDAAVSDAQAVFDSMTFTDPARIGTDEGTEISFETTDLDGNTVTSADLFSQNKITMVNFWFSRCQFCVQELPDLEKIHQQLQEKGCGVLGVTINALDDELTAENKQVLADNGITYPCIKSNADIDAAFECMGYPTTYFVDQNGKVVGSPVSGPQVEKYIPAVEALLAEADGAESDPIEEAAANDGITYGKTAQNLFAKAARDAVAGPCKIIVKDEDGNPVPDCMVQFCTETMCMMQKTGDDGTVTFDRESNADCHVHVLKQPEGFAADSTEYEAKADMAELEIVLKK